MASYSSPISGLGSPAALSRARSNALTLLTVHLKIHPAPATVHESRLLVQELERFGPLSSYRNLRYDLKAPVPSSAILTFKRPNARTALLAASPLTVTIHPTHITPILSDKLPTKAYAQPQQSHPKSFSITASASRFGHAAYLSRQPHHGAFDVHRNGSFSFANLKFTIPMQCWGELGGAEVGEWRIREIYRQEDEWARDGEWGIEGYVGVKETGEAEKQREFERRGEIVQEILDKLLGADNDGARGDGHAVSQEERARREMSRDGRSQESNE